MIKNLLVLGAGASVGYNYPVGEGLTASILKSATDRFSEDPNDILSKLNPDFFDKLRNYPDANIDRFIKNNPSWSEFGQQIICYTLLKCEKREGEFTTEGNPGENKWYRFLLSAIMDRIEEFGTINIEKWLRILTFNYDVSLDRYLLDGLLSNELTASHAEETFSKIKPIHVYGQLREVSKESDLGIYGEYNYYDCTSSTGKELNLRRLRVAKGSAPNIKIIYGDKGEEDYSHLLFEANNMYFLGFGFDWLNLEKLGVHKFPDSHTAIPGNKEENEGIIFCTNYGDNKKVERRFNAAFDGLATEQNKNMKIAGCSVIQAFQHYITL